MTQRRISTRTYILAAFITGLIFLFGFFAGSIIEEKRVTFVQDSFDEQNVDFSSSQLQYSYVTSLSTQESCPAIYNILYANLEDLEVTRLKLVQYARESRLNDETFNLIKRKYSIEQVKYWLLSKQAKEVCGEDIVTVLYFYSDDDECPECGDQEFVLNYVKNILGPKVLIFALDAQFDHEPMINLLKSRYDVNSFPYIVIEDVVFPGFQQKDVIVDAVCTKYDVSPENCNVS
jgi:hypothetical protein